MLKGFKRNFVPLEVLSEGQVDAIWEGIFGVLERTGLKFEVETLEALNIFQGAGCNVDYGTKMVRFPKRIVEECLETCPSTFRVEARDHQRDLVFGGDTVYISSGPGMHYLDIDSFEPRVPTRKEYYEAVTVYDALPNLHILHPLSPNSTFEGIPAAMHAIEAYAAKLRNSTKSVWGGSSIPGEHIFTIEMDKVAGIKGLRGGGVAIAPLGWDETRISNIIARVREGFPSMFSSGPVWGSSAPATLAGAVISMSVEIMGGLVLAQLIRPGHPVVVGTLAFPQNMRQGSPFFGNIAIALGKAAFSQTWRRYRIPTSSAGPSVPNSKCMDFQCGYEKGMLALANAICGDSMVWIHGGVYGELTAHPVQAIMDDDVSGMVGRFLQGIEVNQETLAVDLIEYVGAGPDYYLNKKHTRDWWKKEQFVPAVADTSTLPEWLRDGKKSAIGLARDKMDEILATHKVSTALTQTQETEIERILEEARNYYRKKGRL